MKPEAFRTRVGPYALAAACALISGAVEFALMRSLGEPLGFVIFFPAIVAAALMGAGPGAVGLVLSLIIGWTAMKGVSGPAPPERGGALELLVFAICGSFVVLLVGAMRGRRAPSEGVYPHLFKAVQDISLEGVVVYRALLDPAGKVLDFEYRYANPAACAIMTNPTAGEIIGAKLLERLPLAREHPQLFMRYVRVFATGETSEAEYELGGRWFHSTAAKLDDGLVVTVQDVSARRRGEEAQKLLLQELNHRVKNLLAAVIAMTNSTERGAQSVAEFRDKLSARLFALSRAHGLLSQSAWTDAEVGEIVRGTLEPHLETDPGRFGIHGPEIRVSSDAALALNMALHELATNAIKYGALSGERGRIEIAWKSDPDRPGYVRLTWIESGGPRVSPPSSRGFGTRLLDRAFATTDGEVELQFLADGVFCEMRFASAIVNEPEAEF